MKNHNNHKGSPRNSRKYIGTNVSGAMLFICFFITNCYHAAAQPVDKATLYSKKTLQQERIKQHEAMWKYAIIPLLGFRPDSINEHRFQSGLWAISQFMFKNDTTKQIVNNLFANYPLLQDETKRALMEVVYGLYQTEYIKQIQSLWTKEKNEKLTAMMLYYLYRNGFDLINPASFDSIIRKRIAISDGGEIFRQLLETFIPESRKQEIPPIEQLFAHQKNIGCKIIYSFQREDRDYPGLAIIQNADGSFVKDEHGKLKSFVQLARSASSLPYFITNGNTPQGIYRIAGIEVSKNQFIGPTPNIQLRMPNEIPGDSFFIKKDQPVRHDSEYLAKYKALLPPGWQTRAMTESFYAGKCGRTEIIAHGSTIDPEYFKGWPFYPCTPTLGCLCGKETWDSTTGKLLQSDQLDMVNAFLSTPATDGYLFVINIGNQEKEVTKEEVEKMVNSEF